MYKISHIAPYIHFSKFQAKHEQGEPEFKCDKCSSAFFMEFLLVKHQREAHATEKNFSCDICAAAFVTQGKVNRHKRETHMGNLWLCSICKKDYRCRKQVRKHQRATVECNAKLNELEGGETKYYIYLGDDEFQKSRYVFGKS